MTVAQLIDLLSRERPDAEVRLAAPAHDYGNRTLALPIAGVRDVFLREHSQGESVDEREHVPPDEDEPVRKEVLLIE